MQPCIYCGEIGKGKYCEKCSKSCKGPCLHVGSLDRVCSGCQERRSCLQYNKISDSVCRDCAKSRREKCSEIVILRLSNLLGVKDPLKMCDRCYEDRDLGTFYRHYLKEPTKGQEIICAVCLTAANKLTCSVCNVQKLSTCFHANRTQCIKCYNHQQKTKRNRTKGGTRCQVEHNARLSKLRKKITTVKKRLKVRELTISHQEEFFLSDEFADLQKILYHTKKQKLRRQKIPNSNKNGVHWSDRQPTSGPSLH